VGAPGLDFETWETTTLQVQIHAVRALAPIDERLASVPYPRVEWVPIPARIPHL